MESLELQAVELDEFCPSCGEWVNRLVPEFGWCAGCVVRHHPNIRVCSCGNTFPSSSNRLVCPTCNDENWLRLHADRIEDYLAVGYSFTTARQQVRRDIRPDCINCNTPIRGGRYDALFCTTKKECVQAYGRYNRLRQKGMSREEAAIKSKR